MRIQSIVLILIACLTCSCKTIVEKKDWRYFSEDINIDRFRAANEALGPPAEGEDRVVFMGNSITEAWPVLSPELFESGQYIARGVSGQTSPQMLLRFKTDVIDLQPSVVVILAGTNDIAQNTGYTPNDIVLENIEAMAELASYHDIEVILSSVIPAIDFPWKPGLNPAEKIKDLNQMIKSYAKSEGFIYLDYYSALVDSQGGLKVPEYTTATDLVHPNKAGYQVMEGLVTEAIDMALLKSVSSGIEVNSLFSDHMVIQRNDELLIWGEADPLEDISIQTTWGASATMTTAQDGKWIGKVNTADAGGPHNISVSATDEAIEISDVMIGEVWLASGQSNMQMPLKGWPPNDPIQNSEEEISKADYSNIRMFTAQMSYAVDPQDKISGVWKVCTPHTAKDFSATAYFFAKRLHDELGIPVGIIHSSWGGTVAEAWTSQEKLRTMGDFDEALDLLNQPENKQKVSDWYSRWETMAIPDTDESWSQLEFYDDEMTKPLYNDRSWQEINLPARFDVYDGAELNGIFWFRKTFELEEPVQDYALEIGAIDDMDQTFINGVEVGSMTGSGKYNLKRSYKIPKSVLKKGKNTIVIKAVDTGGPGMISGMIMLQSEQGKSVDLSRTWRYIPIGEIANSAIYRYDSDNVDFTDRPSMLFVNQNTPSVLYNAMINPLIPYTIKGAIWYQGESNVGRAEQYEQLFPTMIRDWRARWGRDFPFYFVQLAPYGYTSTEDPTDDQSQKLRDAQRKSLSVKNTGMAVTLDVGNYKNIHPANKQDVGARLAGLALKNDYMRNISASGPLYQSHRKEGRQLILSFTGIGSGLASEDRLQGFEIAGDDRNYHRAEARVVNNQVIVYSTNVKDPTYVRYGWSDEGATSLFNKEGLPASSFTSEK